MLGLKMTFYWFRLREEILHDEGQIALTYALEKGVKQTTIPPDERAKMLKLLEPLADDWLKENSAKGLPAKQWYDEFFVLLNKYNAQY